MRHCNFIDVNLHANSIVMSAHGSTTNGINIQDRVVVPPIILINGNT